MIADLRATRADLIRDLALMDQRLQANPFDRLGIKALTSARRMTMSSIRALTAEIAVRERNIQA